MLRPLAEMPAAVRHGIRGVLTDIDDTLTRDGLLGSDARAALGRLSDAAIPVVAITGRPAGLCEQLLREWPIDAIVGENGGVWMRRVRTGGIDRHYGVAPEVRRAQRERLLAIARRIVGAVPGAALASDQSGRETDVAIDWAERVGPLARPDVERIVAMLVAEGLTTAVSSIHIHGWYGAHDKLVTTRALFSAVYGIDLGAERERFVYVGDAPNDAPMFAFFPNAVGVANLRRFLAQIATPPTYVTRHEAGAGFAELVDALLHGRPPRST